MTRRRSIHALLGTLALIAGCSTTHRTEVSGVVRDRATGRVIPGARVVGADGSLTRTDVHGRFTLYVRPGSAADVRVSADGHEPERVEIDGIESNVELSATTFEGDSFVIQSTDTSVLAWATESWATVDGGALDSSEDTSSQSTWTSGPHADDMGEGTCSSCHADELSGEVAGPAGAHAGLADSCLACHAARLGADPGATCGRCHGASGPALRDSLAAELSELTERAALALDRAIAESARARRLSTSCGGIAAHFTQVGGAFVLVDSVGAILGDCDGDRHPDEDESWTTVEALDADVGASVRRLVAVERDHSRGAHAPDHARRVLRSLER